MLGAFASKIWSLKHRAAVGSDSAFKIDRGKLELSGKFNELFSINERQGPVADVPTDLRTACWLFDEVGFVLNNKAALYIAVYHKKQLRSAASTSRLATRPQS